MVAIGADSTLTVKETIAVVSEGRDIKRGINRDFPTTYKDSKGLTYIVGFEVLGVKRDGRDEPYTVMSIGNGKRIRIGSADVLLEAAERYAADPNREDAYTKLPATWLNAECWDDGPLPDRGQQIQPQRMDHSARARAKEADMLARFNATQEQPFLEIEG